MLNIYVDVSAPRLSWLYALLTRVMSQDTILYRSIYMYLLNHTDIRAVHPSLFERKNCLAVFSVAYVVPALSWIPLPARS